jgi:hypothetical protein
LKKEKSDLGLDREEKSTQLSIISHRKNEIISITGKWVEMEILMLSEISETEKDITYFLSCIECKPKKMT